MCHSLIWQCTVLSFVKVWIVPNSLVVMLQITIYPGTCSRLKIGWVAFAINLIPTHWWLFLIFNNVYVLGFSGVCILSWIRKQWRHQMVFFAAWFMLIQVFLTIILILTKVFCWALSYWQSNWLFSVHVSIV